MITKYFLFAILQFILLFRYVLNREVKVFDDIIILINHTAILFSRGFCAFEAYCHISPLFLLSSDPRSALTA